MIVLKNKIYFVAATGTDMGKTFLVENLCRILTGSVAIKPMAIKPLAIKPLAIKPMAIKPIASGFNNNDNSSDPARILKALGLKISKKNFDAITPWRFTEAISPHFAARNSGQEIAFCEVVNFCQKKILMAKNRGCFLFIEGAGGVMTPINEKKSFLDLIAALKIPVLLLSASYLGSISHTLCAIAALENRKIFVEKVIINENLPSNFSLSLSIATTITNFSGIKTITLQKFIKKFSD